MRKSEKPVKNPKGAIWKALKEAVQNGAKAAEKAADYVSKSPKNKGLGR